jgi:TPR repeat protein
LADVDQGPLVEPRAVWDRASHHRDLSEAERGRQQQQRSPPPQNDARFLSPAYGEAEERLADHHPREGSPASASTKRSHPTRQPSVASYYSVYSLNSDAPPSPTSPAPGQYHTPPQSSQGHSSEENGSPTAIIPSRTAGASMTKAKRSIDLLRPPAGKASIKTPTPSDRVLSPDDPEDCLQLGIACHESGQLERSAFFFERAATLRGGCGTGMLLWGLTLRHGWGCAVDPTRGFAFLQKAAETVVDDLDGVVASGGTQGFGGDKEEQAAKAAKAELVLSIYELGMSFRKGWGVKKDKKMVRSRVGSLSGWAHATSQALSYFELASTLGDPDAQQGANGGCASVISS